MGRLHSVTVSFLRYMSANTYLPPTKVIPGFLVIANITNAVQMVITVVDSEENTYIENQVVYLSVPASYGMFQANGLTGVITNINGLNFTLDINSTQFDVFIIPSGAAEKPATLSPAGSRNLQYNNSTRKVPFQSLNNRGN